MSPSRDAVEHYLLHRVLSTKTLLRIAQFLGDKGLIIVSTSVSTERLADEVPVSHIPSTDNDRE
jgi:hypothetical protein